MLGRVVVGGAGRARGGSTRATARELCDAEGAGGRVGYQRAAVQSRRDEGRSRGRAGAAAGLATSGRAGGPRRYRTPSQYIRRTFLVDDIISRSTAVTSRN